MAIKHATVKVPGQTVAAIADWNANHIITGNVNWQGFDITNLGNLTATGTVSGGTITDGTLSITGGDLTTTGDGTFNELTVTAQSGCKVYRSVVQALLSGVWTRVLYTVEVYDNQSEFTTSPVSQFRADTAGILLVVAWVQFDNISDGKKIFVKIVKNSTDVARAGATIGVASNPDCDVSTIVKVAVNDTIHIEAWHNEGANRNLEGGQARTGMSIHRLA